MRELNFQKELGVNKLLNYVGECKIKGTLYSIGDYPALVDGNGVVKGQLFEVLDTSVFKTLDEFEIYKENDIENSEYIRKIVILDEPRLNAWIYTYNWNYDESKLIKSGSWLEFLGIK